ncbi:MAG: hypothetical protein GZ085_13660 [Sulfuriferula multivorans]|uniref:Uncharacterized protein n=1 Tax=Sulfuriferula multivorans TaxID=1559896 RepID=A0A7C9TBF4_9PROT|nr:hypothetical protein [Sulfuriferula multivorans]
MKSSNYTVVFASDDRGVAQLGVAMYSLFTKASNATTYRVYVLSSGISGANVKRLNELAIDKYSRHSIAFIDVSDLTATCSLQVKERGPVTIWTHVFIPNQLPEHERFGLYCNIDALVCCDLKELYETLLQGKSTGVVLEPASHKGSHFNERLGMLLDLDVFRKQDLTRKILQYAEEYSDTRTCTDQDALNGALCHNIQPMHPKWNWHDGLTRLTLRRCSKSPMNGGATLEDSVDSALRPGVLYNQGPNMPWR